jgi:hypothetical protein
VMRAREKREERVRVLDDGQRKGSRRSVRLRTAMMSARSAVSATRARAGLGRIHPRIKFK